MVLRFVVGAAALRQGGLRSCGQALERVDGGASGREAAEAPAGPEEDSVGQAAAGRGGEERQVPERAGAVGPAVLVRLVAAQEVVHGHPGLGGPLDAPVVEGAAGVQLPVLLVVGA